MKIFSIIADKFKLDGGASFGTVPKTVWQKQVKADENNMIEVISRCLLIEEGNRLILIDTGMGDKQDEKYFSYFHLFGNHSLKNGVLDLGYKLSDITDVVLTHLHFDHCGGTFYYKNDKTAIHPLFENAQYWCSQQQWDCAMSPNPREKAAYFSENIIPLKQSNKLNLINENTFITDSIELRLFFGHTLGQLIPFIEYQNKKLVYMADFIPSVLNIPIGYIASFDTQPIIAMKEKEVFLSEACERNYTLFFEHDIINECCDLELTDKGIRLHQTFTLNSFLA